MYINAPNPASITTSNITLPASIGIYLIYLFIYLFILFIYLIYYKINMADFWSGAKAGFMAMLGMSSLYNPLGDASSQLNGIKDRMTQLSSMSSLTAIENIDGQIQKLITLNNATAGISEQINKQTKQFVEDSLQQENLFILFVYILVFVIVFFLLIQKKCC
jgi:uncharacterized membrane protein YagU involved in acid resistance